MTSFRILLIAISVVVVVYTVRVGIAHGWNLLPVFFGDIGAMTWNGQFNLDFTCLLLLAALWVAWRHQFSPTGLALAILPFIGGSIFISIYLFAALARARGNVVAALIGPDRASR